METYMKLNQILENETWVQNKDTGNTYTVTTVNPAIHKKLNPAEAQKAAQKDQKSAPQQKAAPQGKPEMVTFDGPPPEKVADAHQEKGVGGVPKGRNSYETAEVNKLIDFLGRAQKGQKVQGVEAEEFDLCTVQIPGSNLFCSALPKSKEFPDGVPRQNMPQLKGSPKPNSEASKLVEQERQKMAEDPNYKSDLVSIKKTPDGEQIEVNSEHAFRESVKDAGFPVSREKVDPSTLKSTQAQLVGSKIAGMAGVLKQGPNGNPKAYKAITDPIFVSEDGYILDGHHRWAAIQAHNLANPDSPIEMKIERIHRKPGENKPMDAMRMIQMSNDFADQFGIASKAAVVKDTPSK